MSEVVERVVAVETQLKSHNERLNRHGDQIDSLRQNDIRLEGKIDNVCKELNTVRKDLIAVKSDVAENTEMTKGIKLGVKQILWIVSAATTVFSLWQVVSKMGWF